MFHKKIIEQRLHHTETDMNNYENNEDISILLQVKQGNEQALALLMKRYYTDLYNYASRFGVNEMAVKDAIQEVFISLWHRRETANEIRSVRFYLVRAIKNRILKYLHHLKKKELLTPLQDKYEFNMEPSAEQQIIQKQTMDDNAEYLKNILTRLPARQKEIIFLKYYLQLDNEQIAELMSINRQSVYNLLYESLQKLKTLVPSEFAMLH